MRLLLASLVLVVTAGLLPAQAPLHVYGDHLVNGFQDWSWCARNLSNTAPVYSGPRSVAATASAFYQGLSFARSPMSTHTYSSLSFWIHGGTNGGQSLYLYGEGSGTGGLPGYNLPKLTANTWQQFVIPLSALSLQNRSNFTRFTFQFRNNGTTNTFFLDDVRFEALPAPATIALAVKPAQVLRPVDARWFGMNVAVWDGEFKTPRTLELLREMGTRVLRFPGGSLSDEYYWRINKTGTNTWQWVTSFTDFARHATNLGAQAFITVNYGASTAADAAGWVRHSNLTNKYGFKYWEIGNENFGTWENDTNNLPHHAYTYATRASDYLLQMRAADPTIRIGVVAAPGENSYQNGYTDHPVVNPRTGQTNYGWTPILLSTLSRLNARPDFLVHHHYPQWTMQESDPFLLQSTGNWAKDAADLRQQIVDYFGPAGTNIELVVTENNSNSGNQGKQSTSLVNGVYYADSLTQLMRTEFNAFVWWDLRNGTDTRGSMDPLLYGWRPYGSLGIIIDAEERHPTFYAAKLCQYFGRPGDQVVSAASAYPLLACHAVRQTNGALAVLVINKDTVTNLTAQLDLGGFLPAPSALVRSYGLLQDEAARTNGPAASRDLATNTLAVASPTVTQSYPPLSLTLITFAPAAPSLSAALVGANRVLTLLGQPGTRYYLQRSGNLATWVDVATNYATTSTLSFTNPPVAGPQTYYRAVWRP